MNFTTFQEKLSQLNSNIYVDTKHRIFNINKILGTSGIYLKDGGREKIDATGLESDLVKSAEEFSEHPDTYLGWTTHGQVYEGDKFEDGKLVALGWRTIVRRLVRAGVTTKHLANKVFGWEESDYDRMNFDQKRIFECQQNS